MRHLSVAEAAQTAGIKSLIVLRAIQSGRLPAIRTAGGDYEVDITSLFRVLAAMYDNGRGVPQDFPHAAKWYQRAAEDGDAIAQSHLASMYYNGRGVARDSVLAHTWFDLAASEGNKTARKNRDSIARLMTPDQIAEARRLAREQNAKANF